MPFVRPTLQELLARVQADVAAEMGLGPLLPRSVELVLARMVSLASHNLHAHLDWSFAQAFPDTAEALYLERWAAIWGVNRTPPVVSAGNVTATGNTGAVIPQGSELRSPTALRYRTTAEVTLAGPSGSPNTVAVTAVMPGPDSDLPPGVTLTWVSPPAGVAPTVTVAAPGLQGGQAIESDDALLQRLLRRIQKPPQGGAVSDYEAWALEVSGVKQAWVFPQQYGAGTVGVAIAATGSDPIPVTGLVEDVQELVDQRRPVTAQVTVWAPEALEVDLTIALVPPTATVRAAVEAALSDLFLRDGAPGGTITRAQIEAAIVTAPGWQSHILQLPVGDVQIGANQLPVLGVVTWL